jgi:hypothetical protein
MGRVAAASSDRALCRVGPVRLGQSPSAPACGKHPGFGAGNDRHMHLVCCPALRISRLLEESPCCATHSRTDKQTANDLAIRQATEELKGASDYAQVCDILRSAFSANDFDGFELKVNAFAHPNSTGGDTRFDLEKEESLCFEWSKPGTPECRDGRATWILTLELSTSAHRWLGSMKIYRFYTDRAILVNVNLLTSAFPAVLADALDRALVSKEPPVSNRTSGW